MDKRRGIANISTSILSRLLLLFVALYVQRLLIQKIGNDANGLNSLYSSIIGMLAVAELGVGNAIIYSMYAPIVKDDKKQVAALYRLHARVYRIIGLVILMGGLAVMPFLPRLIGDYRQLSINVFQTYFLSLIAVVLTYLFSAKTYLIEAYKDNYLTTGIATASSVVKYALQAAAILLWRSFTLFLVCQIIGTLLTWVLTEIVVRRRYGDIISMHETVEAAAKHEIIKNIKAMFLHKVGEIMVTGVDNLVISGFIGVVILGKYNNYVLIASVLSGTIALFFTPLTSIVGQYCVSEDREHIKEYFYHFYYLNFTLGLIFFLGYYAVIDYAITICFGAGLIVPRAISFVITLNKFTWFMRRTELLFRNATGTFYHDRWKPIVEGTVNLVLSIAFVLLFPEDLRVVGVIVATIITTLSICYTVEPYIIFKHVFAQSPKSFYLRHYAYVALFTASLVGMHFLMNFMPTAEVLSTTEAASTTAAPTTETISTAAALMGVLLNGFSAVGLSLLVLLLLICVDKGFRREAQHVWTKRAKRDGSF